MAPESEQRYLSLVQTSTATFAALSKEVNVVEELIKTELQQPQLAGVIRVSPTTPCHSFQSRAGPAAWCIIYWRERERALTSSTPPSSFPPMLMQDIQQHEKIKLEMVRAHAESPVIEHHHVMRLHFVVVC
jgi:hypothetical protein